jgi:hypothetical protein
MLCLFTSRSTQVCQFERSVEDLAIVAHGVEASLTKQGLQNGQETLFWSHSSAQHRCIKCLHAGNCTTLSRVSPQMVQS